MIWRLVETQAEVDFDELPGGDSCLIEVVVTDGVKTTASQSEPFTVAVKPCRTIIFEPADGSVIDPFLGITLRGQGLYLEEDKSETRALWWRSSRDGELGRGMVLDLPGLSAGEHEITLIAGEGQRAGKASVRIYVPSEVRAD